MVERRERAISETDDRKRGRREEKQGDRRVRRIQELFSGDMVTHTRRSSGVDEAGS